MQVVSGSALRPFAIAFLLVPLFSPVTMWAQRPGGLNDKAWFQESVELKTDIVYGDPKIEKQKLDVLKPQKPAGKQLPCIVWIHGGGWQSGSKNSGIGRLAPYVASGEYVGVCVAYRLTDVAPWPAQIYDCKGAIRWVRAHAEELGIDPEKIGVWGSSAGGHLVAMLGTSGDVKELEGEVGSPDVSSRVTCVVDYFGPTDFIAFGKSNPQSSPTDARVKLLGGTTDEKPEVAKQASPTTHVTKDDAPILMLHGTKDPLVPLAQSELLGKKLTAAGVENTLIVIRGAGHGFGGPEIDQRVKNFFAKHLQGKEVEISAEPIETGK